MKTIINIVNTSTAKNDETANPTKSFKAAALWSYVADIFGILSIIFMVIAVKTQDPATFFRSIEVVRFLFLAAGLSSLVSAVILVVIKKYLLASPCIVVFAFYIALMIHSLL